MKPKPKTTRPQFATSATTSKKVPVVKISVIKGSDKKLNYIAIKPSENANPDSKEYLTPKKIGQNKKMLKYHYLKYRK